MATTQKGIYYPNDYTKVADVPADMKELAESVDAVIDDINNDINLANRNLANVIQLAMTNQKNIDTEHETNTQQDKDIANLKTENEELKAENERLNQDLNALPSNEAEGEYITLTDSADSRFNMFKIKGNSIQNGEPTPSNQIKIQNVEGNINIITTNENLFLNGFATPKSDTNFWSGISRYCTPLQDGWGKFSYKNTTSSTKYIEAYTNINFWKNIIKLNTEYTIIAEWKNANLSAGDNFAILDNNSYSIFNGSLTINSSDGKSGVKIQKFTTKNNFDGIRFLFRSFMAMASGSTASIELRVSLIEGDTTETEVKVENQEYEFPLSEGQKLYEDSYLAEDGIHHKRKQFVVDGTETIYNASLITDKDTVSFNLKKPGAVGPYYGESPIRFCNIYGEDYIKDWGYFSDKPGSLGVGSTTNQLRFVIDNSFIGLVDNSDQEANQEKVANWLKDNNIVVEEEVDEYVEAYTDKQKKSHDKIEKEAKTYKTVTNIFSTNEISPKFEVNYRRDIDTYIDNKLANVNEQILNIAGGN